MTVINEFGLCAFLFRGQEPRQLHGNDWKYIKKGDAVFAQESDQINSEDLVSADAASENKGGEINEK